MAENGTVAYVSEMPVCDICKHTGTPDERDTPAKATHDFRTKDGRWAFGCDPHYKSNRMYDTLGTGKGQRLSLEKTTMIDSSS